MAGETALVVEDDIISAEALCEKLADLGYTVLPSVDNGEDAVRIVQQDPLDLVIMDIKLSGPLDGIATASTIQKQFDIPIIYMTAYTDDEVLRRARTTAPYSYLVKPIRDREMQITIAMALYRHRMEAQLKERERWLDTVLHSIGDAVVATDETGRITFMNPVAENLSGWSFKEASGKQFDKVLNLINKETGKAVINPVSRVLQEGKIVGLANHTVLVSKDGIQRYIDDSAAQVIDEGGRLLGVVMVFRDVTQRREMEKDLDQHRQNLEEMVAVRTAVLSKEIAERRKIESRLREEADFRRAIIDNIAEGLCVWEKTSNWPYIQFSLWNDRMKEIIGYTMEQINKEGWFDKLYPDPEKREQAKKSMDLSLAGELQKSYEQEIICADAHTRTLLLSSSAVNSPKGETQILTLMRDISQRKHAEQERDTLKVQLIQAQKMEAIGTLAGGIAHDFNNILGVIVGQAELAMHQVLTSSPIYNSLLDIQKAAMRSANLIRQLLAFARKQVASPIVLDLNNIVHSMLNMLTRLIGEEIELVWRPGEKLWQVKIDPAQIDQILANLCVNTRDAIDGVGKVTIETQNVSLDEIYCAKHPEFMPGDYVMLAVSDNGRGMNKETLENIFEPFFTTKEPGEGTGLGLSTVFGIVKQNKGFIYVYSEPGLGATFKIYLPRTQENIVVNDESPGKYISVGTETVLLVEDEESILKVVQSMLELSGYSVLSARTPGAAIAIAEQYDGPIHLLITDVVMPEMNGKELRSKIEKLKTNIKVLFMSGYTANVIMHRGILEDKVHFIQKPFSVNSLVGKVREVLDQK